MGTHALLSASSSHRWLNCTPSARLEETFANESSVFAAEGTAAHALAEHKLRCYLGKPSERPRSEFDDEELERYTDQYVEFAIERITLARQKCKDPIILIEQHLDYSQYVPDGFGTGDLIIIADGVFEVHDMKYGKGVCVSAEDNTQMMLYALGALILFEPLYDIQSIRMNICQPRLENWSLFELSVSELINWAETVLQPKAALAFAGEGEFIAGDHCRFCRARFTCRARADAYLGLARHDFVTPILLTDAEIAEVLVVADRLSQWASDIYAYATDLAIREGKQWENFKLVEGRSNRRYIDEKAVIQTVTTAGVNDIFKQSLLGITEMERLLGKKRFNELLSGLVEKPAGKPTLVPLSDKRPPISNTAQADFKEEK